ncbi:MAG: glycosyltransferase, partial [Geobacteraceae bacterium]|nr:glycosyltransferase [Geobacteraceae bacterium]
MSHKYDTAAQVKIKVSAIVSTYNSELFIEGCLNDLIQQTLFVKGELEIVVIDSGSEQNEAAVVMQMQQEYPGRIIYARTERETLYAAWNRGIIASTGTYITNANTDDRHRSDALELLCNLLDEHADIDLVYGDCYVSPIPNETYEQNSRQKLFRYPDYFPPAALLHYQFGPQSMWRKSVHEKIGLFDGSFHAAGDYDFNIRFALKCKALHIPDTLGLYLETPSAISFRDDRMASENQIISERYCNSDTIFALYKSAGVPCETDEEKSHVLLDMGVRAIEYYPPWNMGKVEQNLNLAQTCFMKAYQLTPTWPPAHNNLAVTLFHAGKLDKAFKLLEQHVSTSSHTVIQNNVQKIREYKGGIVEFDIFGSDLELPSQKDLSNKQIAASDVNNFCTHNSQDNNFNVQTQRTVGTVLLVIHGFPPHEIAGTQLYVHSVAKQLHRLGNTVRVLFPKYTGEDPVGYIREYEEEGILISTISVPPISEPLDYRQLYEKFNNEQVALSYKKFISRIKPDVVHFHHFIGLSASIIKSTRECNIPIVITLHDGWFFCDQYHFIRPDGTFCDDGPISDTHCAACFSKRNPSITSDIDLIKLLGDRKKYLLSQLSFANTIIVPSRFLLNKLAKHGLAHPHIIVNHLGLPPVISSCNRSMDTGKIRFAYVG